MSKRGGFPGGGADRKVRRYFYRGGRRGARRPARACGPAQGVRRQSGHAHLERLLRDRGRRGSGPSQGADAVRPGGCAGAGTEPHRGGRVPCERTALLGGGRKGPKAVPGHAFQCPRAL